MGIRGTSGTAAVVGTVAVVDKDILGQSEADL